MDTNYAARGGGPERARGDLSPRGSVTLLRAGFVAAVLVQVWVLYLYVPSGADDVSVPHADKVVHVAVFALPALIGVLARLRPWFVGAVLALHAPLSEMVQHRWIPGRAGDPWDVVADLAGILLGLLVGVLLVRRRVHRHHPVNQRPPGAARAT